MVKYFVVVIILKRLKLFTKNSISNIVLFIIIGIYIIIVITNLILPFFDIKCYFDNKEELFNITNNTSFLYNNAHNFESIHLYTIKVRINDDKKLKSRKKGSIKVQKVTNDFKVLTESRRSWEFFYWTDSVINKERFH